MENSKMNMIEKVARAINYQQQINVYGEVKIKWEDVPIRSKAITMDLAKAAIEAMREPTDKAAGFNNFGSVFMDAEWERMIDAALKE